MSEPEEKKPERPLDPFVLDDLIAGIQGQSSGVAPIKVTSGMLDPRSQKWEVPGHGKKGGNHVEAVKPIKYQKKKKSAEEIGAAEEEKDLAEEVTDWELPTEAKAEAKAIDSGRMVVALTPAQHAVFRRLVIHYTGISRLLAFGDEDEPTDQYSLWMFYNVVTGSWTNTRKDRMILYEIRDYTDFTVLSVEPGDNMLWEDSKHVVMVSAFAPVITDFKFLRKWMPV